jgi:hypothetical protein
MKIVVVYSTCGIARSGNAPKYIESVWTVLAQRGVDFRVIISSCRNTEVDRSALISEFKGCPVSFNWIDDTLPVNITFNHSCLKAVELFGEPNAFLYMDSGVSLPHDHCLAPLCDLHLSGHYAMTAGRVSTDSGTFLWFNRGAHPKDETGQADLYRDGDLLIPVGKTVNLHLQLFDSSIFRAYDNRIIPDIFASFCTESVFSFLCAAVRRRFVVSSRVVVDHRLDVDWRSAGFEPGAQPLPFWQHLLPQSPRPMTDIIADPEARACGFGYEECQAVLLHDPTCYAANGDCLDPDRLLRFLKANLYLPPDRFDYGTINHRFIP